MPFPNANTNQSVQHPALARLVKLINIAMGLSLQQNKCLVSVVYGGLKKQMSWILVGLQYHFNLCSSMDWNDLLFKVLPSSRAFAVII